MIRNCPTIDTVQTESASQFSSGSQRDNIKNSVQLRVTRLVYPLSSSAPDRLSGRPSHAPRDFLSDIFHKVLNFKWSTASTDKRGIFADRKFCRSFVGLKSTWAS